MRYPIISLLLLAFSSLFSYAQEVGLLPSDPRIIKGKMDNGLTYYMVQNPVRKNYADFYLIEKIGTAIESDSQKGMTEFLCNLGLRSTRNFPDGDLFTLIDNLGMVTSRDCEIKLGTNECLYRLSNVPVGRSSSVIDSALLVLFNLSSGINVFDETMAGGKVFFANSFAGSMTPERRALEGFRRTLYPDTPYAPIEAEAILDSVASYNARNVRDFYRKWYRPDLQALVVVGDIKPADVKAKVLTLFQATSKHSDPLAREYPEVPLLSGPVFACVADKEAVPAKIAVTMMTEALPRDFRMTAIPLVIDYMNKMLVYVLEERLSIEASKAGFPIHSTSVRYGNFLDIRDKEGLTIEVEASPANASKALSFIVTEIERMKRSGIAKSEYLRARDSYLGKMQYVYDWRINLPNQIYADRCINNFFEDYSLASIEMINTYIQRASYDINAEKLNTYAHSFTDNETARLITCVSPSPEISSLYATLQEAYSSALNAEILPYEDVPVSETLISKDIRPGKIVSTSQEPITGATLWNLSNGAQVVVKNVKSEPEKIYFEAVAKGGLSLYEGDIAAVRPYVNEIAKVGCLGTSSPIFLDRLMKSTQMEIHKDIGESLSSLKGNLFARDIKSFMELIHLHFTGNTPDDEAFTAYWSGAGELAESITDSPDLRFKAMVGDFVKVRGDVSAQIDYHSVADFISSTFSNAADYTFIFVGDINSDALKDLVCEYIASIPGNVSKKRLWKDGVFYIEKFDKTNEEKMPMQFPRYFHNLQLSFPVSFDVESIALANVVSQVIERRMVDVMFDKGVYVDFNKDLRKFPEETMSLDFSFITASPSPEIVKSFSATLNELAENGVSDWEANSVKAAILNQSIMNEHVDDTFWIEIIKDRFVYSKDFYTKNKSSIESLTPDRINSAIKETIAKGTKSVSKLSPTE